MVDKPENILVEFDYNNISVIDPNKVIDENGRAKERVVKQENLVMYANLECNVLPRTKLAVGVANNDAIQTISIASINFLNPGGKTFLDNSWTDELTGKDTIQGKGVNQPKLNEIKNPNKSGDYYIRQTMSSNGNPKSVDNGLLGITSIDIRQNTSFMPVVTIKLIDVKGRALFEAGDSSPYAAFFNLPYPMFHLTIKGYYGKAVKLPLMLQNFTSSYNYSTTNFDITLTFYTYKYTMLAEIMMGGLLATPNMYKNNLTVETKKGTPSQYVNVRDTVVERGYQKIREVYSEYKSKGLIPEDFPELTLAQMRYNISNFVKNIFDSFTKQNMTPLTNLNEYQKTIDNYRKDVFTAVNGSWFSENMDNEKYLVLTNKTKIYTYKKEITDTKGAKSKLEETILKKYNDILNGNKTVGQNGSYKIGGKGQKSTTIKCEITINDFIVKDVIIDSDVDWVETYIVWKKSKKILDKESEEIKNFKKEVQESNIFNTIQTVKQNGQKERAKDWFVFQGPASTKDPLAKIKLPSKTFDDKINDISKKLKEYKEKIETDLTEALSDLLQNKNSGLGFIPNIRNVLAVIFANGEGFIRLLDDVHKEAWDINSDPELLKLRKNAIFNTDVAGASQDNLTPGDDNTPIYPWPQLIVSTPGENGQEKYEIRYPGDEALKSLTKVEVEGSWPEVEFVEEFIRGLAERQTITSNTIPVDNNTINIKRVSFDAIEFPIGNDVYSNKEEVKFFYEIYERLILIANISKLSRASSSVSDTDKIVNLIAECESINLNSSLSSADPFLIKKLTDYGLSASNYLLSIRHFSNQGLGQSWQNYIRGVFNTNYINNRILNGQFDFLNQEILNSVKTQPQVSIKNENDISSYITGSTTSNEFDFTDTYPFTDNDWVKLYLANSISFTNPKDCFNTTKVLNYNQQRKIITNFVEGSSKNIIRPVTVFNYLSDTLEFPKTILGDPLNLQILKSFYNSREIKDQVPTEGRLVYSNYDNNVTATQTTSILNTPYFINSIQEGIQNFRDFSPYPFVSAAYYFINSLPIATLREKYKSYENNSTIELDYIFATIKKYGAIHKVPYAWALKLGSVWHRYKKHIETGVDILDASWNNFNYVNNYDPLTDNKEKVYSLNFNNSQIDIVLQKNTIIGSELSTLINTGFYPKLINDFNVFYQGFEIYTGYTESDIQTGFTFGVNLNYANDAIVNLYEGFDESIPNRDLRIIPWSVSVDNFSDTKSMFVMPSHGSLFNQTLAECFNIQTVPTYKITNEVFDNQAMYDGSVRLFWASPNYGYFDNSKVTKPQPDEYFKKILNDERIQESFSISGNGSYTKISEIFSVFEKNILDKFEQMFLNFSKSIYDSDLGNLTTDQVLYTESGGDTDLPSQQIYKNFQALMTEMMRVNKENEYENGTDFVTKVQLAQFNKIGEIINGFLNYDVVFKHGNPSSFDLKLFKTFSQSDLTDPYTWESYNATTPDALPFNGGGVTLSQSKINYPNEWKTLETYVGFSEIPEMEYKNNGSYITDFFIDFGVAFKQENIINFAPIIKIYATQKLLSKKSNTSPPPTTTNQNSYAILQNGNIVEVFKGPGPKSRAVLFTPDKQTILSTTTPSFQPNDNVLIEEIILGYYQASLQLNPIVEKYIRPTTLTQQPSASKKFNLTTFYTLMTSFLENNLSFQNKILDNLMIKVRDTLPKTTITVEVRKPSEINGGTQSKSELYESFKALNDKWIAGYDIKNKTLFEDVLLLDRASRNIGEKILVDIFKLQNRLENIDSQIDMLTFVQTILVENHFIVMNLPTYVNFYNVQDAVKNPIPKPEGTLEFANTLFGTFLNVDYRNSSSKMVCFYGGKPSEQLDLKNNVDYRFRNDAFDLRRASDNPLIENQIDKKDWAFSNKVVGFNIDIGPQNQQIFQGFDVSQTAGKATAESIEVITQMGNQNRNRNGATQSVSLYNLYKNRSYRCQVTMMGNALIQPTMYFNLRNVPMFSGPYMILEVSHRISPGTFTTYFTGIRQPTASLPILDDYLQSLRKNLLQSIIEKIEQDKREQELQANSGTTTPTNDANTTSLENCTTISKYSKYTLKTPTKTTATVENVYDAIKNITNSVLLRKVIFCRMYFETGEGPKFSTNEYNYAGITLDGNWGGADSFFENNYYCSSKKYPYAVFSSLSNSINFLKARLEPRVQQSINDGTLVDTLDSITKFVILNYSFETATDEDYENTSSEAIQSYKAKMKKAITYFEQLKSR
jgi:hypothetical protein